MICLTEPEVTYLRDTLTLLLVVHSRNPPPSMAATALEIFKADGATGTEGAQVAILERVLKISEKFL